jgi:hypothetical protein
VPVAPLRQLPAAPAAAQPHHFKPPDGYVDRKRAAAGDRDED